MKYLILYIVSFVLGWVGAWLISRFGFRFGLMDIPNERSSHEIPIPVPKSGGIGILAAFIFVSIAFGIPASFWLSATLLALFSFLGDRVDIPPRFRLSVQFAATLVFLLTFPIFSFFGAGINPASTTILILFYAIFIVGTANFYNFLDGINGIGGITGVIAFGLLGFYAFLTAGDSSFVALALCMSLACVGFLPFNMPKARVFMGDVGSVLLGFVFAGMVVWFAKSFVDFVCMSAFLFPFYIDELSTMCVRLRADSLREGSVPSERMIRMNFLRSMFGRMGRLIRPHRRHLYQLLANEMGMRHWKVSVGYGILQFVVGMIVLFLRDLGSVVVLLFLTACFAGFVFFSFSIRKRLEN